MALIPIVFELDEELNPTEEMIGIKTIRLSDGNLGYVAMIRDFSKQNHIRHGNLRAVKYTKQKFGGFVL